MPAGMVARAPPSSARGRATITYRTRPMRPAPMAPRENVRSVADAAIGKQAAAITRDHGGSRRSQVSAKVAIAAIAEQMPVAFQYDVGYDSRLVANVSLTVNTCGNVREKKPAAAMITNAAAVPRNAQRMA